MNIPLWMQSSVDPSKTSKTVEGALLSVSSLVLWAAAHYGFSISADQYVQAVSNITQIVFCASTAWGLVQTLAGSVRKIAVKGSETVV